MRLQLILLLFQVNLQSGCPAPDSSPAINVKFSINQMAVSGIKVNRLDMYGEVKAALYNNGLFANAYIYFRNTNHSKASNMSQKLASSKCGHSAMLFYFSSVYIFSFHC
jgi:hypothetical protein